MNTSRICLVAFAAALAGVVHASETWNAASLPSTTAPSTLVEQDEPRARVAQSNQSLPGDQYLPGGQYSPTVRKPHVHAQHEGTAVIFRIGQKTVGDTGK